MAHNFPHSYQTLRPFSSVRFRLTLWNVGVMALILCSLGLVLRYSLLVSLTSGLDRGLHGFARAIQNRVENPPPGPPPGSVPPWAGHRGYANLGQRRPGSPNAAPNRPPNDTQDQWHPRVLDRNGSPLTDQLAMRLQLPGGGRGPRNPTYSDGAIDLSAARRAGAEGVDGRPIDSVVTIAGDTAHIVSLPAVRAGQVIGVIQVGHSMADITAEVNHLTRVLLTLIPLGIIVAGLGGAFLTGRALQPVRRITVAASQMEAANLSDRLEVKGHDEFALLAATFNSMLDRLENAFRRMEEAYEQQRRFTGDASHELRTPLTIIKANASLSLAVRRSPEEYLQTLKIIDQAADRTNRIIQDLLLLARADGGQLELNNKPVAVAEIVQHACTMLAQSATAAGPKVVCDGIDPALKVSGSADMLTRLLDNLLGNAIRHTPAGGEVRVKAEADGDRVRVSVADTGEGIAPEHLPHLMERFYRVDAARSRGQGGTGLGLAICKSIVDAHGGELSIQSVVGQGTIVTVTLPRDLAKPAIQSEELAADAQSSASKPQPAALTGSSRLS